MKYSLGLDIGTSSIGWAVVNEDKKRIEDLGVRIFERPENPKNGESLAAPRRNARSARRRLHRRRERLNFLKEFFIKHDLLSEEEITRIFTYKEGLSHPDPYLLRAKAIQEKISNYELFIALYHIAKRRGYKSNRKAVEETDKESGRVLSAIQTNQPLLVKNNNSVACTLLNEDKFKAHKHNKDSEYSSSFIRSNFKQEILTILETQDWSEEWIQELLYSKPEDLCTKQKSGIFYQRPFMTRELMEKMRGYCQYEKDEPRAPKASYSFELFRIAQNLAHLEYNQGEKLTPEEIDTCVKEFKKVKSPSYATIRKALGHTKDQSFQFDDPRTKQKGSESNKVDSFRFYHQIKDALKERPEEWKRIEEDIDLFDRIGEALTINKDDEQLERALLSLNISPSAIAELMKINVSGFGHLSIRALRKLTPHLLNGNTYIQAVESCYPGESTERLSGNYNELPQLSKEQLDQLTNPVVKRSISQTRKVINAVIRKYGAPCQIKFECANELAKSFSDRKKIEKQQKENAEYNEQIKNKLVELSIPNPTGQQIIKYKLREQQDCKCVYCGQPLGTDVFSDDRIAEIDHIIPFSRCGNDNINNKVLVCAKCNQEKKNRTPFETWGSDPERWNTIVTLANNCKIPNQKRDRLLCEKPPKEEWNIRALNDTRYMTRFMTKYIKQNLKFSNESKGKQKVIAPTGFITNYLRKIYGIGSKDRGHNNYHHAVDACIIATISQGQIQKIANWNKYKELGAKYHTAIDYSDDEPRQITTVEYEKLRGMLPPWEDFTKEVRIRSGMSHDSDKIEKLNDFRDKLRAFKSYDEEFLQKIHPLFISRMAKHSFKGQAHEETYRSPKTKGGDLRLTRKKLNKEFAKNYLKYKNDKNKNWLDCSVLPESDLFLYQQIKTLLEEKGENAFDEPIYKNNKKVDKNGNPISPVRTVKVYEKKPDTSGVYLNHDKQFADNGKTICLNVYRRKNTKGEYKYYAAPLYAHSLNKKEIPILPTPTGRSAEEKSEFNKLCDANGLIMASPLNGFELTTQVYPNDYIKITYPDKVVEGYYVKYGVATGQITILAHNQPDKDHTSTCALGSAAVVELIPISVLGDSYKFE